MPKFPNSEADILQFAYLMLSGYSLHGADFPSVEPVDLLNAYNTCLSVTGVASAARSAAQLATETKKARLGELTAVMKNLLKKSEVDTAACPEKLSLIGWGPRQTAAPVEVPGPVGNLICSDQQNGICVLKWFSPCGGGPVRNYVIQRRRADEQGIFGAFEIAASSLVTQISLTDQPRGVQLEYRAVAVNAAGQGGPSNPAAIVL